MNKHIPSFDSMDTIEYLDGNPLAVVNDKLIIIYANKAFTTQFKLGKYNSVKDIESEPDLDIILESFPGSKTDNLSFEIFWRKSGQFDGNVFNVFIERLNIQESEFYFILFKSLTENNRIEKKINNLYNTIEQGNFPLMVINEYRKITYISESFEEIFNCKIESLYNSDLYAVLDSHLDQEESFSLEHCLQNNMQWSKIISVSPDSEKFYELKLKPLSKKNIGADSYILTASDVSSLVQKNRIIKKSELQLRSIINNISDLLLVVIKKDNSFLFENANENFCDIFEMAKEKCYKKNIMELFDVAFLNELVPSFRRLDIVNTNHEEFFLIKNLKQYSAKVTFILNLYEDEKIYIITLRDITEQIEFQEQLKKAYEKEMHLNKLKTIFLENMSHEIRTPFNALAGYSDILNECLQSGDLEEIKDFTSSMKDVLHRILNLFTNIVEVSQIESGEIKIEKEIINCASVLRSIYNKKNDDAREKNLNFIFNSGDEPVYMETDWIRFEKVICALIENSIKYTDNGKIVISLSKTFSCVEIKIDDSGKGIKEDEIPRLLEPFEQYENGYTRATQGAGLGLTIAYKLTMLLGGTFDIRSSLDAGTSVKLTFPLKSF